MNRLTASSIDNIEAFKAKLSELRRSTEYVDWRGASDFARELEQILDDLAAGCSDPELGVGLVTAFFEADAVIFEHCDDSDGSVGTVFDCDACDLFVRYASDYPDKSRLIDRVIDLRESDEYGVRDAFIKAAHRFLFGDDLRLLAQRIEERSKLSGESWHWLRALASVARQLKDASLYEKAQRSVRPELSDSAKVDIAEIHLENGDATAALSWLKSAGHDHRLDGLLMAIHRKLGNQNEAAEVAWRSFRSYRNKDRLTALLSIIGENQRECVIANETRMILGSEHFSETDAAFLIEIGRVDEAETYILDHARELDGDSYVTLLAIAQVLECNGRCLAASVVYRALLDSMLERAYSKAYHHGIDYLRALDKLAAKITDWKGFLDHDAYKRSLRRAHSRKSAFWPKYDRGF